MEIDSNPYRELPVRITPEEFELFCMETLRAYAAKQNLIDFTIKHNQKMTTADGTYQIDVLAEYTILGCKNTMIVECKNIAEALKENMFRNCLLKFKALELKKVF